MPPITRRNALGAGLALWASAHPLASCGAPVSGTTTRVHVMGTIHRRHRTSADYSLAVLKAAIRRAQPDVILTEIPPSSVARALATFNETGKVDEARTNVFPEYTDVVIPLAGPEGWQVIGTAAWTPEIAQNRRRALAAIRQDPRRADQWAEHRAATRDFVRALAGRSDDPRFVHTNEFDRLVATSREPYARYFDADLGPGGWTQINKAHNALINAALDRITGQGLSALVTFGTAHKYKIIESLMQRSDIALEDTRALFE